MHLIKFINYNLINYKILNISTNIYEQINTCTKYKLINKYNNNKQLNKINLNYYNLLNYLGKILDYVDLNDITVLYYIF
jgi:hypothetical protein